MIILGSMVEKNWTAGIFVAAPTLTLGTETDMRRIVSTTQRRDLLGVYVTRYRKSEFRKLVKVHQSNNKSM